MAAPKPLVKAMLICDSVITDKVTSKNSLIGIFENISTKKFPCVHGRLGVYINFTDAKGDYVFKVELFDLTKNAVVGYIETPSRTYKDMLSSNNLVCVFEGLKFDHPGSFEFRLYANNEHRLSKKFQVKQI